MFTNPFLNCRNSFERPTLSNPGIVPSDRRVGLSRIHRSDQNERRWKRESHLRPGDRDLSFLEGLTLLQPGPMAAQATYQH